MGVAPYVSELEGLLGEKKSTTDLSDLVSVSRDVYPAAQLWTRRGEVKYKPDVIVWPENVEDISAVMKFASQKGIPVTALGGGSGVCAGAVPIKRGIVLDMKRMNRLISINDISFLATVEAGMIGEMFERELNARGYTLGHFPSSIYCSTVGGWIAARSAGQYSSKYGKIEDMIASLTVVLADGTIIRTNPAPREATGPDIDQVIAGSEGTLGIVAEAILFINLLPKERRFSAWMMKDMETGIDAMRLIMRAEIAPAVARLYDPLDTKMALASQNIKADGCLMILLFEGDEEIVDYQAGVAERICSELSGKNLGEGPARYWLKKRYAVSYKQSQIFAGGEGTIVDTIETATTWSKLLDLYKAMMDAIKKHCLIMAHVSHIYPEGAGIYFSVVGNANDKLPDELYERIWETAMTVATEHKAALSHHHGVGMLKGPWMEKSLGTETMDLYRAVKNQLDPKGILNPGKMGL